jgi:rRNA pseudouridine-1189 N-methylase Emg1 (Nep1/Mra1 family)
MTVNPEEGHDEESNIISAETNVEIPKEYADRSAHMTQVLEAMMERQRLEMHRRLNEMFKTYFDARANMENKEDEHIDDELNL